MARTPGTGTTQLAGLALARSPYAFDPFETLRRLECAAPDQARLGQGQRPAHEPVRLGQEPSLSFASAPLAAFIPAGEGRPARLLFHEPGLLGPSGPLPLHLTEYARERTRNAGDPTLARFLDIFHHRVLSLFYRAWANSRPTVSLDRPAHDRFAAHLGALCGAGTSEPIRAYPRLHFAGRLMARPRNPEGLLAMVRQLFGLPVRLEPFVGVWLPLSARDCWRLGAGRLGQGTALGARTWQRQGKFRLEFGPLDQAAMRSLLPGGDRLLRLQVLVRHYVGTALTWDVRLRLDPTVSKPLCLGADTRLGLNTWLGSSPRHRQDVIFDPGRKRTQTRPTRVA